MPVYTALPVRDERARASFAGSGVAGCEGLSQALDLKGRLEDHFARSGLEIDVREVVGRNLQRVGDEVGSLGVDALVQEAANFAQLHLDGVAVFQQGENADLRDP